MPLNVSDRGSVGDVADAARDLTGDGDRLRATLGHDQQVTGADARRGQRWRAQMEDQVIAWVRISWR
jgi:hypothetical protein